MSAFRTVTAITAVILIAGCGTKAPVGNQFQLSPSNVRGATINQTPGGTIVHVDLGSSAQKRLAEVTAANVGQQIEVVVGTEIVSRPMVREAIKSGYVEISCDSPERAQAIVNALKK